MRNVRQSTNEAQTRHPPWAISRGARHCSRDRSLPPSLLPVDSPLRDRRKRISRCDIAMQSSLWMNLHYSANGVEKVRTRAGLVKTGTTCTTNELVGPGPRGRAPSSRAARASRPGPHPGPHPGTARASQPPCCALARSGERAPFFTIPIIAPIARTRCGTAPSRIQAS